MSFPNWYESVYAGSGAGINGPAKEIEKVVPQLSGGDTFRQPIVIRTIGGGLRPEIHDDSPLVNQEHAGQLAHGTAGFSPSQPAQDRRLEAAPPDPRPQDLAPITLLETERAVEIPFGVGDPDDFPQTEAGKKLPRFFIAGHMDKNRLDTPIF